MQGKTKPIKVPQPWVITVDQRFRDYVFERTGCSVSLRERQGWGKGKRMVVAGPVASIKTATDLGRNLLTGDEVIHQWWAPAADTVDSRKFAGKARKARL